MTDLCVVFDIDDTLYLERDYVTSGFAAVSEWTARWLGIRDFARHCDQARSLGLSGSIFNAALSSAGREPAPELIGALVAIYRSHRPPIHLLQDAARAIDTIGARWPIAIITDGPMLSQSRKAEALELSRFASPVILTECLGRQCSKPSPVAFRQVMTEIPASRYVYIADNPAKDFHGPSGLGWNTVRIRREGGLHFDMPNTSVAPDHELPDCTELPELLSSLPRNTGAVA